MRMQRRAAMCVVVVLALAASVVHGAIYYINDGDQTNAAGSTFATPTGTWSVSSSSSHTAYGGDYTLSSGGDATGTFTFAGPTDCYYVYAGWSPPDNPASRTQDGTITVTGLTDSIVSYPVNHEKRADGVAAGSNYSGSGFFPVKSGAVQQPITLGAGSTIVYSDGTEAPNDDRVSADVVVLSTDLLIDDISTLTTQSGAYVITWNTYTNNLGEYSYGYTYAGSPTASDVFSYDLGAAMPGDDQKTVKASWLASSSGRDTDVKYRVTHKDGTTDVVVNQLTLADGSAATGPQWSGFRTLGTFNLDASSTLEVIPSGSGNVSADTIALANAPPWDVAAHFNDGNTAAKVDGYAGKAGNGWTGGWEITKGSATVATADPLGGPGDPYLSVASYTGDRLVRRQYEAFGDLDPALMHRISWQWRFDGNFGGTADSNDRFHFFGQGNAHTGSGGDNSWLIGWIRADGTYDIHEGNWYFYDRVDGSFTKANMVNTGLGLDPSAIYNFAVTVYPEVGTYDAWMSDGTDSFAAYGLTFRNGDTGVYDWIHFGGTGGTGDNTAFSLDSVELRFVPEPATVALLGLGGLAALARRRRRR